jgi:hypothetical protein
MAAMSAPAAANCHRVTCPAPGLSGKNEEGQRQISTMISLSDYWMDRDVAFLGDLTDVIVSNADALLDRVNGLLARAAEEGVEPGVDPDTGTAVSSGWRPKLVNDVTPNASKTSKHVVGLAVDLCDTLPERPLARWCLRNKEALKELGLWMEDPRWTPTWVHLQSEPPASGNRVFVPSTAPALAAALPEQLSA